MHTIWIARRRCRLNGCEFACISTSHCKRCIEENWSATKIISEDSNFRLVFTCTFSRDIKIHVEECFASGQYCLDVHYIDVTKWAFAVGMPSCVLRHRDPSEFVSQRGSVLHAHRHRFVSFSRSHVTWFAYASPLRQTPIPTCVRVYLLQWLLQSLVSCIKMFPLLYSLRKMLLPLARFCCWLKSCYYCQLGCV